MANVASINSPKKVWSIKLRGFPVREGDFVVFYLSGDKKWKKPRLLLQKML